MKTDGFLTYKPKNLSKVNSIRRVISAPDSKLPPILNNGQVLFSSAESAGCEPRSCYNCTFYNYGKSCKLMGSEIEIRKFTFPKQPTSDSKPIEYWPVCSYWIKGEPNYGTQAFIQNKLNPDDAGLIWINAPSPGLKYSGSCCGGQRGGDDCDYFLVPGPDKRSYDTGFCRVLQHQVNNVDCCSAWHDDDECPWTTAQERLKYNK